MEMLQQQVKRARRRLFLQSLAGKLAWSWFGALAVAAVAIGAGKYWAPPVEQRTWALGWLAAALILGFVAAAIWTWSRRQSTLAAALEIDRRFGLKERVSSTLALDAQMRESEFGRALVCDAERRVGGLDLADGFRFSLDRRALLPLAPAALAFALATLVPVAASRPPVKAAVRQTVPVKNATRALVKRLEAQKKEAVEKNLPEAEAIAKLEDGVRKLSESKENDRQQTLLKLNDLVRDAQQRREELASSAELKKQLAGLKNLEQGSADKLTQALKSGNLDKAIEEIKKLQKLAAEGKLDAEQQKALARQLQRLQQQLAQNAEAQQKQAEQLKQQIAAQRRAGNQEAADKLQEQLDKIASQQNQHGNLSEMAAQLQSATKSLSEGNGEEAAEALAQLGQQLSGMQENLQELESLDLALAGVSECKQAMACQTCQGDGCEQCQPGSEWKKSYGDLGSEKTRGGGKGIGVGLGPGLGDETNPDGKFFDSAVKQQPGLGRAMVVGEADGPNRKGRVQEEIQAEFTEGAQKASDALSDQRLPRDYRDHAQKYFDTLREGKP